MIPPPRRYARAAHPHRPHSPHPLHTIHIVDPYALHGHHSWPPLMATTHGTTPSRFSLEWQALPHGSKNCLGRTSCAYSYITPLRHLDDGEIEMQRKRSQAMGAASATNASTASGAAWHRASYAVTSWLDAHVDRPRYRMLPSWRPKGSYLRDEPCWGDGGARWCSAELDAAGEGADD